MARCKSSERIETQRAPRVRVVLPVICESGAAWTRDVSTTGVYFTLFDKPHRIPQPGSRIRIELVLEHVNPDGPFKVACESEVVRVEEALAHVGVAVRIRSYQFGSLEAPLPRLQRR